MRKSLLTLGKFDEDGCKFSGRNGQLIITKGVLVVANGELKDGQYQLMGKTMVGEARVTSVMAKSLKIYHRCLGMSKRD